MESKSSKITTKKGQPQPQPQRDQDQLEVEDESQSQGGMHVLVDHCLICNNQCYLPPKMKQGLNGTRIAELRTLFYSVYEIPVPPAFVQTCSEDLPLCPGCIFKLGRLQVLQDQLSLIQKEYIKLREGIAFSIVDVVAASNDGDVWGSMELRALPLEVIQRYLKQSEVDTLQHMIFDEWHERYSTDLEENFDVNSFLPRRDSDTKAIEDVPVTTLKRPSSAATGGQPQQKKNMGRPPSSSTQSIISQSPSSSPKSSSVSAITKTLINGSSNATATVQSDKHGRKTTVISITTHEDGSRPKKVNPSGPSNMKKRKIEPSQSEKQEKRAKSIQIEVDGSETIKDEIFQAEDEGDMVISMSPGQFHSSGEGYNNDSEYYGYSNEHDDEEHGVEGEEADQSPPPKRVPKRRTASQQNGHPRGSGEWTGSPDPQQSDVDYENMSLREMAEFLGENVDAVEEDPERQKYLANVMAELQSGNNIEYQQNEEGLYVCMFCNKTFIHKYPYRDHLKTHTGEGPRCPICNKIFPKNHNLMLHLRTHTGEKPFKCDVCNKGFADKSNLKVHYRVHTGEKPYKCDYCDQAFVNSSRLVVHRRLHTGERPFPCDICGKSFSTSNQLGSHRKIHGIDQLEDGGEGYSAYM